MKILGIESSSMVASVAIADENITIAEYTINHKKTHSQTLLPMLDEIVKMTETDMKDMNKYKPINIKMVPKYISPYTAITSENWDESVRAAVLMKGNSENTPESPLEKVLTM